MMIRLICVCYRHMLESEVNKLLADGWQLHGQLSHSVCWATDPHGAPSGEIMNELFVQAMVKT